MHIFFYSDSAIGLFRQHIPNGAEVVNVVQARHLAGVMEGMPRGIRGIMGLSWPKEKLAIEAENQVVQEQINLLEAEQATQLAKLGEMQVCISNQVFCPVTSAWAFASEQRICHVSILIETSSHDCNVIVLPSYTVEKCDACELYCEFIATKSLRNLH